VCLTALPDPFGYLEIDKYHGDQMLRVYKFRWALVVGVPIAEVANTLAQWLRGMAGSHVGHLDTKTTSLRSACLKYLGLTIPGMSTALPT
jgi:hypothetical protein